MRPARRRQSRAVFSTNPFHRSLVEIVAVRHKLWSILQCEDSGYFLYIAQLLGHEGLGLDLDELPMFGDLTRLLGVRRVIWEIKAFDPLPDVLEEFDLITAFLICFNRHKQVDVWGVPEWEFFLDDLAKHLTPRGRVWLELNQEYDGTFYTPELKEFFQKRGAKIDRHKVSF